jgi:hypothetical protein
MNNLEHLFLVGEFPARDHLLSGLTLEQVTLCPDGASHSIYEELWHVVGYQQSVIGSGDPDGDRYPRAAPEHDGSDEMILTKLPNQKRITLIVQLAKMKPWLRFALIVSLLMFGLTTASENTASVTFTKGTQQVPLVLLESSEGAINQGFPSRAIAASATDAQILYTIDRTTEEVVTHETQRKLLTY